MNRTQLSARIRADWRLIVEASRCRPAIIGRLPSDPLHILGSSLKTEKGEGIGVLTAVAYLAPAESSGREVCPMRSLACTAGCLGEHAGRMGFDPGVKRAQLWKTALRFGAPHYFRELVCLDIRTHAAKAARLRMIPAVRLDGTSDLGDANWFANEFPSIQFYDYTKVARRLAFKVPNWHRTLSYSGTNIEACAKYLLDGGNVAVPFDTRKGEPLPEKWHGFPVINGDETDYRPGDAPGTVVGLSWKGPEATRKVARSMGWI